MSVRVNLITDKIIRTVDAPNHSHTDAYTIMCWFKIVNNRGDYSTVFAIGGAPNSMIVQTGSDGTTLVFWNTSTEVSGPSLVVGQWYHVAFTHSTAGVCNIYVDGVLQITDTNAFDTTSSEFEFGNDSSSEWADGEIDGPRLWQAELTSSEVLAEKNSAIPVKSGAWSYYDFTNAASAPTDQSGNLKTLTLTTISDGSDRPAIFNGPTPTLSATDFRARNDDGSETTATWLASQNTNFTFPLDTNLRIRYLIDTSNDPSSKNFRLEVSGAGYSSFTTINSHALSATLTYGATVTGAFSTAGGTTVSPSYPSGITTKSALVMFLGMKPSTANLGTVTTPTGWTLQSSVLSAGGYGATLAADTGNTNLYCYTKDVVSGTETGSLTVTVATNNVCWAEIIRVQSDVTCTWSFSATTASDSAAGNAQLTFATDPGVRSGDMALVAMCIPTDVTTPAQFSAEVFAQAGIGTGYNTVTEIDEPDSTVGNDIGGLIACANVSAGTSIGVPVFSATTGGTTTNVRGPGIFLRVRATPVQYPVELGLSSNISAGGQPTTPLLTPSSGKSTSAFTIGRMWDDENGTDSLDISGTNGYTEIEWSVKAIAANGAANNQQFVFRVTDNGALLDSNLVSPLWTLGTAGATTFSFGVMSATYSIISPSVNTGGNKTVSVDVMSATYSLQSPNVQIPKIVSASSLSGSYSYSFDAIYSDATLTVNSFSATYLLSIPTVNTGGNKTVSVGLLSATYSSLSPTISGSTIVQSNLISGSYSLPTPQNNIDGIISLGLLSATYSVTSPLVNTSNLVSVSTLNMSASMFGNSLSADTIVGLNSLSATYSVSDVSIISGSGRSVSIGLLSATYSVTSPQVNTGNIVQVGLVSGSYSITSIVPGGSTVVQVGSLNGTYSAISPNIFTSASVSINSLSATYSLSAPTVNTGRIISVSTLNMSASMFGNSLSADTIVGLNSLSATYSLSAPIISVGSDKAVSVGLLSATYSLPTPTINRSSIISVGSLSSNYLIQSPNIQAGGSTVVQVGSLNGSYSVSSPLINTGNLIVVGPISSTYSVTSPQVNTGNIVQVGLVSGSLNVSNIQINIGAFVSIGLLSAIYSVTSPQVNTGNIVQVGLVSGSYSPIDPIINVGGSTTVQVGILDASYSIPIIDTGSSCVVSVGVLSSSYSNSIPQPKGSARPNINSFTGTINISNPTIRYGRTISLGLLSGRYFINSVFGSGDIIKRLRRQEGY